MNYIETETVELKEKINDSLAKEIVSFLNAQGGNIFIGIRDDGSIIGASNIDDALLSIANIATDQIEPRPSELIKTSIIYEEGKPIIQVMISKGIDSIYCIKKYGYSPLGCPIRIGSSCREMSTDQISLRYQKRFESTQDYMVRIESGYGDITFSTVQILLNNHGYSVNPASFEANYHLRNKEGKFNLLAELISDRNNIPFIFVKFSGKDKTAISERIDFGRGSIFNAYFNIKNRLIAENICLTDTTVRPRKDTFLFKMNAVDEALLNAIVHNDYSINQPLVSMYSDRLEILSYGGLPGKETKEDFFKGISNPRNQALVRLFQDLDITEQTGHGVPTIVRDYGKDVFDITDRYINVVIPFNSEVLKHFGTINGAINGAIKSELSKEENLLISYLIMNPTATYDKCSANLKIPKRTISRLLTNLRLKGIVIREGSKKSGKWRIVK